MKYLSREIKLHKEAKCEYLRNLMGVLKNLTSKDSRTMREFLGIAPDANKDYIEEIINFFSEMIENQIKAIKENPEPDESNTE